MLVSGDNFVVLVNCIYSADGCDPLALYCCFILSEKRKYTVTNRRNWELGASTIILQCEGGYNSEGFGRYQEQKIRYAELSLDLNEIKCLDFFESPERIYELAKANGVQFWSYHIPFSQEVNPAILEKEADKYAMNVIEKCICTAAKIGIKNMVIHPSAEPIVAAQREQRMVRAIENMKKLSILCGNIGVNLAVENLPRTCLGNCAFEIIRFLKEIPELMLCFDTNHSLIQSNREFLDELIINNMHGRIKTLHVSDYDMVDEKHRLPMDGKNDWECILSRLEELEYHGVFMYEVCKGWDREEVYRVSDIRNNFEQLINQNRF